MYVRQIEIRNFLIHKDTSLCLSPLTVFVGPQGGGKSALFDALLNFSMVSRGNLRQAFGPYPYSYRATMHRAANKIARIGYKVSMSRNVDDNDYLVYEIEYSQTSLVDQEPRFTIPTERLMRQPGNVVLFDRADPDAYPISRGLELEDDRSLLAAIRYAEVRAPAQGIDDLVT